MTRKQDIEEAEDEVAEFSKILEAFSDARAVLTVATQALESTEEYTEILYTLELGLKMFQAAYNRFDKAI